MVEDSPFVHDSVDHALLVVVEVEVQAEGEALALVGEPPAVCELPCREQAHAEASALG